MARDLVADANDNLRATFLTLAEGVSSGERRQFGPLTVAATGVPVPFFNRVFVFEAPSFDEFSAAVDWTVGREVPFWVTVTEPVVEDVESYRSRLDRDLAKATEQPGMAMLSLDEISPGESVAQITPVTDPDERADFSRVAASVFGTPLDVEERLDRAAMASDEMRLFLGSVGGDPVACGLLARTGDVAGVYNVGVVDEFRRRGIGEAMTRELLRAGRDAGCQVGVLQASETGYPLYERMGFETVVTYHLFEPAT